MHLVRWPARDLHPVLKMRLLHRFALNKQLAAGSICVDLQYGGAAVGAPLADAPGICAQLVAEFIFGQTGNRVRG